VPKPVPNVGAVLGQMAKGFLPPSFYRGKFHIRYVCPNTSGTPWM
jgi:hypothetical protein